MRYRQVLEIVGDEPLFETGLLLAGDVDPANTRRQLSRWTAGGKLIQLRRGLYALAPPYQKKKPHLFLVANRLVGASYVSCQSALAYYGLIPEYVPTVTSVTTRRPNAYDTPFGRYAFGHLKRDLFFGYTYNALGNGQHAFVASPEKALLDQAYLQPGGDALPYLRGLRLQNLHQLDLQALDSMARRTGSPKLIRTAARIASMADDEAESENEWLEGTGP